MKNKLTLISLLGFLYIACGNIYAQTPPPPGDQPPGTVSPDIYGPIAPPGDQPPGTITSHVDSLFIFRASLLNFVRLGMYNEALSGAAGEVLSGQPDEVINEVISIVLSKVSNEALSEAFSGMSNEALSEMFSEGPDATPSEMLSGAYSEAVSKILGGVSSEMVNNALGAGLIPSLISNIQPVEPTTASLGKYGEYQMDYSNGLPDISIPLYEIKSGDLTVPIVLRYQGGGIKVQQEATWVGLGWDLFYGGQVTRVVQGFPDETESPIEQRPTAQAIQNYINQNNHSTDHLYLDNLAQVPTSQYSFMPDDYYYNAGMESGKFIGKDVEALIPYKPVKITSGGKFGTKWQITKSNGECYYFNQEEKTETLDATHSVSPYASAWYIDQIVSPNNHSIRYEYQTDGICTSNNASHYQGYYYITVDNPTIYLGKDLHTFDIPLNKITRVWKVTSKKPQYIYFEGGRITFTLSPRTDIQPQLSPGENPIQKLESITVESLLPNNTYSPLKSIYFDYSYSSTGINRRLMLNRVYEKNYTDGQTQNIAVFAYDPTVLPEKTSFSYDYCGYYNGSNNHTPIPFYKISTPYRIVSIGGADKNVVESYTKAGTLVSIEYPTKGKTVFVWENHRYGAEMPLYTQQYETEKTISVDLNCSGFDHSTGFPVDDSGVYCSGNPSETFTCNIDQKVTIIGDIIRKSISNDHVKYDEANIILQDNTTGGTIYNQGISKSSFNEITTFTQDVSLMANHTYTFYTVINCSQIRASASFTYNSYNPANDKYNFPYGGLRIKEIDNYDTDGTLLNSNLFTYVNPNDTSKSSGYITNTATILLNKMTQSVETARCDTTLLFCCINKMTTTELFYDNPITGIYPNNLSYQYVQVRKTGKNNENNGITKYEFKTALDLDNYRDMPLISSASQRGQIIKESIYNNSNNLLEETTNHYSNQPEIKQSTRGFKLYCHLSGISCQNTYLLSDRFEPADYVVSSTWCKLDSVVKYNYDDGPIKQKTEYVYADTLSCQPTQVTTLLSNGGNKITTFQFPSQLTNDIVCKKMTEKNLVDQFVTKEEKIGTTPLTKQTNMYSIKSVTTAMGSFENSELICLDSIRLKNGTANEETEFNVKRGIRNNIVEYIPRSNSSTTYLWSYNYQYPIAKIENATLDDVKTALGYSDAQLESLAAQSNPDVSWVDSQLRNYFNGKTALVTTYTYRPLVGMTSVTDPRGVVTYYDYNSFGRLQTIKDMNGKIIENYEYHYKN